LRFARSIRTILLCCLLFGGCAVSGGEGPQGYVVRPHDTLYSIAWRHDLDYRDLARWNNIGPDFRISVGQYLVLRGDARTPPATPPRAARAVSPKASAPASSLPPGSSRPPGSSPTPVQGAAAMRAPMTAQKWVWPTDGAGGPIVVPGGGILLTGRLGQDVRAASTGRVVYTGSGLRGYGNLIIIKHGESLLSAYAHNREMMVHEGQDVAAGQVIARMGEGAHQTAALYFEIRLNGKPVDPLPYFR
jgi:lipoprotein NlpD